METEQAATSCMQIRAVPWMRKAFQKSLVQVCDLRESAFGQASASIAFIAFIAFITVASRVIAIITRMQHRQKTLATH